MTQLSRPRALVTGASTGIGRELARVLAREGFDLIVTARTTEALAAVADELTQANGVDVRCLAVDLAVARAAESLMRGIAAAGLPVDVLVNNAGVGLYGDFAQTSPDAEGRMIQLNVGSVVALTKLVLPGMLERRRGRILNLASTAAFVPGPHMAVYFATKAFVLSFSEALGEELRGSGITVTALCPGPTASAFQQTAGVASSSMLHRMMMDPRTVAEAGYRGMMTGRAVVVPGARNRLVPLLARLLPRGFLTAASGRAAAANQAAR